MITHPGFTANLGTCSVPTAAPGCSPKLLLTPWHGFDEPLPNDGSRVSTSNLANRVRNASRGPERLLVCSLNDSKRFISLPRSPPAQQPLSMKAQDHGLVGAKNNINGLNYNCRFDPSVTRRAQGDGSTFHSRSCFYRPPACRPALPPALKVCLGAELAVAAEPLG